MSGNGHITGEVNGQKLPDAAEAIKVISFTNENGDKHKESHASLHTEASDELKSEKRRGLWCCKQSEEDMDRSETPERVGFLRLFRFADKLDVLLMICGSLCMMALGVAAPLNIVFFGEMLNKFVVFDTPLPTSTNLSTISECTAERIAKETGSDENFTEEDLLKLITETYLVAYIGIGLAAFVMAYIGITLWTWTGERQIRRVRTGYFEAVMRQSIGWFDVHNAGEINSRMVEDMEQLNDGFGDKMATFIQWISGCLGGYVVAFASGWKLTLVVLTACPLFVIVVATLQRYMMTIVKRELAAYAKAGSVAEETFSSIRTVAAFGGEKKAEERYALNLQGAQTEGVRKAIVGGISVGLFWLIIFMALALALWYGAKLTRDDCLDPAAILEVFFGVLTGSLYLGYAAPTLVNINTARVAAAGLFKTIDEHVEIDNSSEEGLKPELLEGNVEFVDVGFTYPVRKEAKVLNGLNISVKKGQTVALVGESGCGKSTTIQLVQRFYDCDEGKILVDGKDLKDYNLTWLRNYMGIVSQEPVLFATTIGENIRLGSKWGDEITQEQIETAAKQANCYDFITKLPKGFDTLVGERGIQLSGGQKQRIAIARALVRNPAILLLDEATSALDTQSEAIVQDALDKASKGRTTLVVAHRLSTVKAADKIFAFRDGQVHEEGTHDQLMSKKGLYHSLVMRQMEQEKEEAEEVEKKRARTLSGNSMNRTSTEVPHSPLPGSVDRSSSIRRSKRLGSARSLGETAKDGGFMVFSQPAELQDELEDIALEDEVVTAKQLNSEEDGNEEPDISLIEILNMNKPEWYLIVIGTLGAMVAGITQVAIAILLSEILAAMSEPDLEIQEARVAKISITAVLIGFAMGLANTIQNGCLALSGERLTTRLRTQSFAAIVKREISYFDDENNGVGFLTSRLASDASLVKGATGQRIGLMIQTLTAIIAILLIAFISIWELTLAVLVFVPIMMLAGKVQQDLAKGYSAAGKAGVEKGGQIAQEAISNMRTVTSLNRQRYFTDKLYQHFKQLYKNDIKKSFVYGIAFAVSQGMIYFMYALCFGFGGYLIVCGCLPWRSEKIPFSHLIRVFGAMTFGSMALGRSASSIPDYAKAKLAAFKIKNILASKSAIDPTSTAGSSPDTVEGMVELKDVKFSYPTRETVQVLQGVSFTVKKGETLALVGSSGCGKSTSVSLLERFYDCTDGVVTFDGRDVKSLNIQWLRHNLGLVSQEPTLFDTSIAENIAYGDNTREVSMAEIIQVATKANAHNFITSLPDGYETNVGAKGTQLSGGQKQRLAIARALIRNPAVLLLDEATSALDTESEKVVQEALDQALVGRTAIIIAHRLSTIRNANNIGVIDNGKIVEFGTHEHLIEKRGVYFDLVNAQL